MCKKMLFLLAVLALVVPAQAITWDYAYEGDAAPSAPWGIDGGSAPFMSYGTDGGTTYLNIDTFNAAPDTDKAAFYINNAITDITNIGVVIETRMRVYDDTKQVGGIGFGDGSLGGLFNFYCDAGGNKFGYAQGYIAIPAPDPTEWHTYRIEALGSLWELFVDDVSVFTDTLVGAGTYTTIGDKRNAAGDECDVDYDYVRIANVPEPITLLILAGGGLVGLRRRRS